MQTYKKRIYLNWFFFEVLRIKASIFRSTLTIYERFYLLHNPLGELFLKRWKEILIHYRIHDIRSGRKLELKSLIHFRAMPANIPLQNVLEDKKFSRFIMTKTDNRFMISLDLGYVPHHCNTKKLVIYWIL